MWDTKKGNAAYASLEIGLSAVEILIQIYLLELYLSAGLPPLLAGIGIVIASLWDGVSDPLVGRFLDRYSGLKGWTLKTYSLGVGVGVTALSIVYLFSPERGESSWILFFQLLGGYALLNTGTTLAGVPHLSLINDLVRDEARRVSIFGWRLACGALGLILALLMPVFLVSQGVSEGDGVGQLLAERLRSSWGVAALAFLSGGVTFFALARRLFVDVPVTVKPPGENRGKGWAVLKRAFRSRSFVFTVGAFMALAAGRAMNGSLALIYYKQRLGLDERSVSIMLLAFTISLIMAAPLWVGLSRRFDKRRLIVGSIVVLGSGTAIVYPILPPNRLDIVVIVAIAGGLLSGCIVLLESLFSDVVESEQATMQASVSGLYYGVWKMLSKCARAVGLLMSSLLLDFSGYKEGSEFQSEEVENSIAWAFGPGVAIFFLVGAGIVGWGGVKNSISKRELTGIDVK